MDRRGQTSTEWMSCAVLAIIVMGGFTFTISGHLLDTGYKTDRARVETVAGRCAQFIDLSAWAYGRLVMSVDIDEITKFTGEVVGDVGVEDIGGGRLQLRLNLNTSAAGGSSVPLLDTPVYVSPVVRDYIADISTQYNLVQLMATGLFKAAKYKMVPQYVLVRDVLKDSASVPSKMRGRWW